jgi:SAM-dependent methyltransferase
MNRSGTRTWVLAWLILGIAGHAAVWAQEKPVVKTPDVVYVGTPHDVVAKMLELAKVTKDDVVYDLGCGDGRIVVAAAKKYGCRGVGFDVSPVRLSESRETIRRNGVEKLVTVEQKDIFTLDLSKATVITLYLLPNLNVRLIPQLEKMPAGARIVSHDFDMKGVKPDKTITLSSKSDGVEHTIYLWTTPLKKVEGTDKD